MEKYSSKNHKKLEYQTKLSIKQKKNVIGDKEKPCGREFICTSMGPEE